MQLTVDLVLLHLHTLILQAPENVAFTFYGPNSIPVLGTLTSQAELLYEVFHLRSLPSSSMPGMGVMTYPACFLFFIHLDYGALSPLISALCGSSLHLSDTVLPSLPKLQRELGGRLFPPGGERRKDWPGLTNQQDVRFTIESHRR